MSGNKLKVTRSVTWTYEVDSKAECWDYVNDKGSFMTVEDIIAFESNPSEEWARESIEWADDVLDWKTTVELLP